MTADPVRQSRPLLTDADIIDDSALSAGDPDRFDHQAIAGRVAELVRASATPLNIALYGPWGSGKSSFFQLMQRELEHSNIRTVRYDAWKYGGASLKKNFISSAAQELGLSSEFDSRLYESRKTVRLDPKGFFEDNWRAILLIIAMALTVGFVWTLGGAYINPANGGFQWDRFPRWGTIGRRLPVTLLQSVASLGAIAVLFRFADIGKVNIDRSAPSGDEEFTKSFEALVKAGLKKMPKAERLVFFIDELDRCAPKDVVATLIDLKTFLDYPNCVFVVAADREVLETALTEALKQSTPQRDNEPYYSTAGAFLDKIFQQQVALPPLRQHTLTHFAHDLVADKQQGIWNYLRTQQEGGRARDEVIYALIPAHVRSPRRVKVLLNNFATNIRVAEARGLDWRHRTSEIAVLTVLQTEFPPLVQDLYQEPRLLHLLRPTDAATTLMTSDNARRLVSKYRSARPSGSAATDGPPADEPEPESAAGPLLGPAATNDRVSDLIINQLNRYLGRLAAARIPSPERDMLYLQAAGELEGLHNTTLGNVIDLAADVEPAETAKQFASAEPSDAILAVRLLAERSDNDFGPGRDNLIVAACLIAGTQVTTSLGAVAVAAAPSIRQGMHSTALKSTDGALRGALRLAIAANDTDMADVVVHTIAEPDDPAAGLAQVIPDLADLHSPARDVLADAIAASFESTDEIVCAMLRLTSEPAATEVMHRIARSIGQTLVHTANPEPKPASNGADSAAARTSSGARPTTAPAVSAKAMEEAAEQAAESMRSMLEACDGRDDNSTRLRTAVLRIGVTSGIQQVIDVALDDIQTHLATIAPEDLTDLGFRGLTYASADQASEWLTLLQAQTPIDLDLAGQAIERAVNAALSDTPHPPVVHVVQGALNTGNMDVQAAQSVFEQINRALIANRDDGPVVIDSRRRSLYQSAITLQPLAAIDVCQRLAEDWTTIPAIIDLDEDVDAELIELVSLLDLDAVETAAAALAKMTGPASEQVDLLRMRIATAHLLRAGARSATVMSADDLLAIVGNPVTDALAPLVGRWMALHPPVSDIVRVLSTWPNAVPGSIVETVALLAAEIDLDDRLVLWKHAVDERSQRSLWRSAAAGGLDSRAVDHLNDAILRAGQQQERRAAADRLLSVDLSQPSDLKRRVTALATELVDPQQDGLAGRAGIAADLIIRAGGAAHGSVMELRSRFDNARSKHSTAFSAGVVGQLEALGLVTKKPKSKPKNKKNPIRRAFGF